MSETASKMEGAVTIMAPPYMPSLPHWPGDNRFYYLLPTLLSSCKICSISNNSPQTLMSLCF